MPSARDLERQIKLLETQIRGLREEVEKRDDRGDALIAFLQTPHTFAEIVATAGESEDVVIHRLLDLEKRGLVERLDLPRWVRADLPENDKGRILFSETPLRQRDLEVLIARREGRQRDPDLDRPGASDRVQALQAEGLVKLGEKKGDPWYLPTARGTQDLAPARGGQYQLRPPRRGRQTGAPPTPRARGPKDGT
jgi:hypothetical protein